MDNNDRPSSIRRKSHSAAPKGLKMSFFCLVISAVLLLILLGLFIKLLNRIGNIITLFLVLYMDTMSPIFEQIASRFGYDNSQYAVIIDAGSTGSRVLGYKFHRSLIGNYLNILYNY